MWTHVPDASGNKGAWRGEGGQGGGAEGDGTRGYDALETGSSKSGPDALIALPARCLSCASGTVAVKFTVASQCATQI